MKKKKKVMMHRSWACPLRKDDTLKPRIGPQFLFIKKVLKKRKVIQEYIDAFKNPLLCSLLNFHDHQQ